MRRTITTMMMAVVVLMTAGAQGIAFEPEGTTLEQASKKAKAENKLIFLDCYTQWCGPCKKMAREVFPQQQVGAYMNPRFVSLQIDMESAYGAPLAKRLQVQAYPTFIIFNANAEEIGRFLGGSPVDEFLKKVEERSQDNTSLALQARWNSGDRDPQFLQTYLKTLTATYKTDEANLVAEALLEGHEATFAADSTLRAIFLRNINNPFATAFVYTAKHPAALQAAVGERLVNGKIGSVLDGFQRRLVVEHDGTASLDQQNYDRFLALLANLQIADSAHYRLSTLITLAEKQKDYPRYVGYVSEYLANPQLDASDMQLARWARLFADPAADAHWKQEMKKLLQQRLDELRAGKRQPQRQIGNMRLSRPTDELLEMVIQAFDGKMPNQQTNNKK